MKTRILLALLIALALVIVLFPRTAASVPFRWSPAPWSGAQAIPSVGAVGVSTPASAPSGEMNPALRSGASKARGSRASAPKGETCSITGLSPSQASLGRPSALSSTLSSADLEAGCSSIGPTLRGSVPLGSGAPPMPAVAVHDAPLRPVPSGTSVPAPLVGVATWYDAGPGEYAAAGPALRVAGWRGSYVVVCAFPEGRATCLTLPLVDWCACGDRNGLPTLLDLSADAFAQLAPLSQGLVRVTVQEVLP